MRRFGLFALALCAGLSLAPVTAAANNSRPDVVGTWLGGLDISQGNSWSTLTSASFDDMTSTANDAASLAAGRYITEIHVCNTHATQTLYVSLSALSGAVPSVTNRIQVLAGACKTIPAFGLWQLSVSIRGSGAATTGHILAQFVATRG